MSRVALWPSVHCFFDLLYRFVIASSRQAVDDQNESVKIAKQLALSCTITLYMCIYIYKHISTYNLMFTLLHEAQMGSEQDPEEPGLQEPDPEVNCLGEALGGLRLEPSVPPSGDAAEQSGTPSSVADHSPPASADRAEDSVGGADTGEPFRFYAVWKVPNSRSSLNLVGIHTGRGTAAFRQILLANGDIFEGIRFRRAPTLRAAQELFLSEAAQHGVDSHLVNRIYQWA